VEKDGQELTASDYEMTSLKPYVEMFQKHVDAVLRDTKGSRKGECLSASNVMSALG
jgi:hypothetical protein